MDISYILGELHEERKRINEVIQILERLSEGIQNRQKLAPSFAALEKVAKKRQVSPETRAKLARAQRKRWAAAKKAASADS
jgi:CRISPR/Cas system-associated protein Cas7 (RAMP superfamily)